MNQNDRSKRIEFSTTVTKVEPIKVQLPAEYIIEQLPKVFNCYDPYKVYKKEDGIFYIEVEECGGSHAGYREVEIDVTPEQEKAMNLLKPLMDYFYNKGE